MRIFQASISGQPRCHYNKTSAAISSAAIILLSSTTKQVMLINASQKVVAFSIKKISMVSCGEENISFTTLSSEARACKTTG